MMHPLLNVLAYLLPLIAAGITLDGILKYLRRIEDAVELNLQIQRVVSYKLEKLQEMQRNTIVKKSSKIKKITAPTKP